MDGDHPRQSELRFRVSQKGFLKGNRFKEGSRKKIRYIYILFVRLTALRKRPSFLKRKISDYEEIRRRIRDMALEGEKDSFLDIFPDDTLRVLRGIR
nr:hypothetical protein [Desulfobacterales bacterium]